MATLRQRFPCGKISAERISWESSVSWEKRTRRVSTKDFLPPHWYYIVLSHAGGNATRYDSGAAHPGLTDSPSRRGWSASIRGCTHTYHRLLRRQASPCRGEPALAAEDSITGGGPRTPPEQTGQSERAPGYHAGIIVSCSCWLQFTYRQAVAHGKGITG